MSRILKLLNGSWDLSNKNYVCVGKLLSHSQRIIQLRKNMITNEATHGRRSVIIWKDFGQLFIEFFRWILSQFIKMNCFWPILHHHEQLSWFWLTKIYKGKIIIHNRLSPPNWGIHRFFEKVKIITGGEEKKTFLYIFVETIESSLRIRWDPGKMSTPPRVQPVYFSPNRRFAQICTVFRRLLNITGW